MIFFAYLEQLGYESSFLFAGPSRVARSQERLLIRIEIEPVWRFKREGDPSPTRIMLDLLNEIRLNGKITRAADRESTCFQAVSKPYQNPI